MPTKTERGDPLGFSNIHSVVNQQKKLKGGPFGIFQHPFCRKSAKKIEGGTLWSHSVWYVTRENRKNLLGQFARPNGAIWSNNIL